MNAITRELSDKDTRELSDEELEAVVGGVTPQERFAYAVTHVVETVVMGTQH